MGILRTGVVHIPWIIFYSSVEITLIRWVLLKELSLARSQYMEIWRRWGAHTPWIGFFSYVKITLKTVSVVERIEFVVRSKHRKILREKSHVFWIIFSPALNFPAPRPFAKSKSTTKGKVFSESEHREIWRERTHKFWIIFSPALKFPLPRQFAKSKIRFFPFYLFFVLSTDDREGHTNIGSFSKPIEISFDEDVSKVQDQIFIPFSFPSTF